MGCLGDASKRTEGNAARTREYAGYPENTGAVIAEGERVMSYELWGLCHCHCHCVTMMISHYVTVTVMIIDYVHRH